MRNGWDRGEKKESAEVRDDVLGGESRTIASRSDKNGIFRIVSIIGA